MATTTLHHAWFCDDCGNSHREPTDECAKCESKDVTKAPCFATAEHDDAADEARMAEIRQSWDARMERGKKLLADANTAATLEQLVEIARGNYDVPQYSVGFLTKRQAGGAS